MLARLACSARGLQNKPLACSASVASARDGETVALNMVDVIGDRISQLLGYRDGVRSALEADIVDIQCDVHVRPARHDVFRNSDDHHLEGSRACSAACDHRGVGGATVRAGGSPEGNAPDAGGN
eukprot:3909565-Pyramimonas_sp.AAC.1